MSRQSMLDKADVPAGVPYPLGHGEVGITTRGGEQVRIRHIVQRDAPLLVDLFHNLSDRTKWLRFFSPVGIPAERLWGEATRLSDIDSRVQAALIATIEENEAEHAVAVARMIRNDPLADTAEVAIVVRDDFQRQGIGRIIFDLLFRLRWCKTLSSCTHSRCPKTMGCSD